MAKYYLGIDQGTTLTTAVLADEAWHIAAKASVRHTNFYPQPGWVEQDPEELFQNCLRAVSEAMAQIPGMTAADIAAFGLDHQGETCCIWDKTSGKPLGHAIVWQDRRTAAEADKLAVTHGDYIRRMTGLSADAYYSATKLAWILDNMPGARESAQRGDLLFGTLNTYIFWRLSGGRIYKTDPASASCMMLMDLKERVWDETLVKEILGIDPEQMPLITDNSTVFGYTDPEVFFGARIPISGSTNDSSAAIIGGGFFGEGGLKTSYGTGNFMSLQIGTAPQIPENGVVADCVYQENGIAWYRYRGACYTAGAAVEWLRSGIGIIDDPKETAAVAMSVADTGGVYFVPAFAGLATPYWDSNARGAFLGLTGGTSRAHLVRAVLEAIAYQVTDCYRSLRDESGADSPAMRADGGMVDNGFLMQLQADMLDIPVEVPAEKESAAFGAACIAAHAVGGLSAITDVKQHVVLKKIYEPHMSEDERETRMAGWKKAVSRSLSWADEE